MIMLQDCIAATLISRSFAKLLWITAGLVRAWTRYMIMYKYHSECRLLAAAVDCGFVEFYSIDTTLIPA